MPVSETVRKEFFEALKEMETAWKQWEQADEAFRDSAWAKYMAANNKVGVLWDVAYKENKEAANE